jgi:hypothetical protein
MRDKYVSWTDHMCVPGDGRANQDEGRENRKRERGAQRNSKNTRSLEIKFSLRSSNTCIIKQIYFFQKGKSILSMYHINRDRLCGLVVRVLDYRCRGPGFDSRTLQKK